jgi:hypothetical protein
MGYTHLTEAERYDIYEQKKERATLTEQIMPSHACAVCAKKDLPTSSSRQQVCIDS